MTGSLAPSVSDLADFEKLETIISKGQKTFVEVGTALCEIRDRRLYRKDFISFEGYCQTRWGWSRQRSSQLIGASQLMEKLPPTLAASVENERDARALLPLEPKEQKQAIREAKKEGVPIAEKAKSFSEKPVNIGRAQSTPVDISISAKTEKSEPVIDETDTEVPEDLQELWGRKAEVDSKLREIASLATFFQKLQGSKDSLWIGVYPQEMMMGFQKLHQTLGGARLFAVCIVCQGRGRSKCAFCKGKGFISKFQWDTQATAEAKSIRQKSNAAKRGGK